jgi:tRNA(Arg) A34 adenosine deaminase TadA
MTSLVITLPEWVDETVRNWSEPLHTDSERMKLAVALSRINVERGGGPFAALVFAQNECLGAGVNRVVDTGYSIAHAEILALMTAQQRLFSRGSNSLPQLELVTTTEPCCQCFGSLIWAGVTRLVCGATTADAEAIGFDEGPKPENWDRVLEQRAISVTREVRREEANAVLRNYRARGGEIYGRKVSAS